MMMERLYYQDAYLKTFSARVVERLAREGHPAVVLDRTAFYPTGGGQPYDSGRMGDALVVDAQGRPHVLFPFIAFGPPGLGYVQRQASRLWTDPRVVATTNGGAENTDLNSFSLAVSASDLYYATLPKN